MPSCSKAPPSSKAPSMTSSIVKKTPKREKTEENRRKPQERFLAPQTPLGMTAKGKSKKRTKIKKERHRMPFASEKNPRNIKREDLEPGFGFVLTVGVA